MKILFVNANAFLPQLVGGVEVNTLSLSAALRRHGHEVCVLCEVAPRGWIWIKYLVDRLLRWRQFTVDHISGVKVCRARYLNCAIDDVIRRKRPDVIVIQGGKPIMYALAKLCASYGPPVRVYVHDVLSIASIDADLLSIGVRWIANSNFTRRCLATAQKIESTVVPPIVPADMFRVAPGNHVTLVNPRLAKGGHVVAELAALCPELNFLLVLAENPPHPEVRALMDRMKSLRNVTWLLPQSDMKEVYSRTGLLLVPSQVPESWGRVVTEAHQSGIPVVATSIGALPESVGPGGVIVGIDASPAHWAEVVRKLMADKDEYTRLSLAARSWSLRDEISVESVVKAFLGAIGQPETNVDDPHFVNSNRPMDAAP